MLHQQRNARLRLVIHPNINRVKPGIIKIQLLNVHDEIARAEMQVAGQNDLHGNIDARHYRAAIGINKIETELVLPFILMPERYAQGDGALWMHRWELRCRNRVERPEQIEFEVLVRRRIAEDCHLNVHERSLSTGLKLREFLESIAKTPASGSVLHFTCVGEKSED